MNSDVYNNSVVRYRRRPTKVEAMHFLNSNAEEVANWCSGVIFKAGDNSQLLSIPVKEGVIHAKFGDWIVKDPGGKFSVIEDANFYVEYERVELL